MRYRWGRWPFGAASGLTTDSVVAVDPRSTRDTSVRRKPDLNGCKRYAKTRRDAPAENESGGKTRQKTLAPCFIHTRIGTNTSATFRSRAWSVKVQPDRSAVTLSPVAVTIPLTSGTPLVGAAWRADIGLFRWSR